MPVRVVIPTHNSRKQIDGCLHAVLSQELPVRVAVVDNASSDGTVEHVRCSWPGVLLVELPANVGYGAAVNEGAAALGSGDVLALNVDARLAPTALAQMERALQTNPAAGVVAPKLVDTPRGTLQRSAHRFPSLTRLLAEALFVDRIPVIGAPFDYHCRGYDYNHPAWIDWATGAALLVREKAWRTTGGFDGEYFFFVEEVDLQRRLAERGWRTLLVPSAEVVHEGGKRPLDAELFLRSHEGYERYFRRTRGRLAAAGVRLILAVTCGTRAAVWLGIWAIQPPRREEARRWVSMFVRAGARSFRDTVSALRR